MKPLYIYPILIATVSVSVAFLLNDAFGPIALGFLCIVAIIPKL